MNKFRIFALVYFVFNFIMFAYFGIFEAHTQNAKVFSMLMVFFCLYGIFFFKSKKL